MAMDKAEQEDTVKTIESMLEELGYIYSFATEKGEEGLARNINIADVALRHARATLKLA